MSLVLDDQFSSSRGTVVSGKTRAKVPPAALVYYFKEGSDVLNGLGPFWVSFNLKEDLQDGIDTPCWDCWDGRILILMFLRVRFPGWKDLRFYSLIGSNASGFTIKGYADVTSDIVKHTRHYGTPFKVSMAAALDDDEIDKLESLDGGPDADWDMAKSAVSSVWAVLVVLGAVLVVDAVGTDSFPFSTVLSLHSALFLWFQFSGRGGIDWDDPSCNLRR